MKTLGILLLVMGTASASLTPRQAQEIENIRKHAAILQDQVTQAETHVAEVQKQADDLKTWGLAQYDQVQKDQVKIVKITAIAKKNGQERDVFVVLFALIGAAFTVVALVPTMNKLLNLQFPWTAVAPIGLFIALFGAYFGVVRLILSKIVAVL